MPFTAQAAARRSNNLAIVLLKQMLSCTIMQNKMVTKLILVIIVEVV